jgi:hypothetical protein
VTMISRVRISSKFFNGGVDRREVADFKLGVGPCGKTVGALYIDIGEIWIILTQCHHCDGTTKIFHYRVADIIGRIEVEYG